MVLLQQFLFGAFLLLYYYFLNSKNVIHIYILLNSFSVEKDVFFNKRIL